MSDQPKQRRVIRGVHQVAAYRDKQTEDEAFAENPLIMALPAEWEWEGENTPIVDKLTTYIPIDRNALAKLPSARRIIQLAKFKLQFFQVLSRHRDLERSISLAIRFGYQGRNPAEPRYRKNLHDKLAEFAKEEPIFISGANLGFSLLGSPGLGKSISVARILRLNPQVIYHRGPELHHTQIVWLFLTCAHDKSTRGLCLIFFQEIDAILGSHYHDEYSGENVLAGAPRKLDPANPSHMTLLRLAKSAAVLTSCAIDGTEGENLRQRYLARAMQLHYASAVGCVLWAKLVPDFRSRYSNALLEQLACTLPANAPRNRDHWLSAILRKSTEAQAPVRHLMLMDFLGLNSEDFFRSDNKYNVLGAGPWECENTVCPKFHQPAIVEMRFEQSTAHQCPLGLLTCPECGHERAHVVIDGSTRSWVRNFGPLWYDALKRFWLDTTMGIGTLAAKLGVVPNTAESHAAKINLPFPRIGPQGASRRSEPLHHLKREGQTQELLKVKRSEWLALRAAHPTKSTTEIIALAPACYSFLHKRDREWLGNNSPASRRRPPPPQPTVDWNVRDKELSVEVAKAVLELRLETGIPKLLTITAVGIKLGKLSLLQKYIAKLPLTRAALESGLESNPEFACRKIVWEANCLRKERINFDQQELILRARLTSATLRDPALIAAIDAELPHASFHDEVRSVELAA